MLVLTFVLNPLSQMLHLNGLSLVCERMWISKAELQAKVLKQIWQVVLPRAAAKRDDGSSSAISVMGHDFT